MMNLKKRIVCTAVIVVLFTVDSDCCTEFVGPNIVSKSWQSSSFTNSEGRQFCGLGDAGTPEFFRTDVGSSSADQGYHWLVMRLTRPIAISTVIIRSATGIRGSGEMQDGHADGIEVWTSALDLDFGQENCSSRSISSAFVSNSGAWKSCSRAKESKYPDDLMTADCTAVHWVRLLLLRKYVANINLVDWQQMRFKDMYLKYTDVKVEIQPSEQVKRNSTVTVRCSVKCSPDAAQIKLCHGGSCFSSGILTHRIASVQPNHSGNYTCGVADEVFSIGKLNVLYPPSTGKIFVSKNCIAQSPLVTFAFESSAAEPAPHHVCTAFDSTGNSVSLMRQNQTAATYAKGSLRSQWVCQNCSFAAGNVTVQCSAVQLSQSSEHALHAPTANVLWNISARISSDSQLECRLPVANMSGKSNPVRSVTYYQWAAPIATIAIVTLFIVALVIAKKSATRSQFRHRESQPEFLSHESGLPDAAMCKTNNAVSVAYTPETCTYASLMSTGDQMRAVNPGNLMSRADSELTVYLEIVAVGPGD